MLMQWAYACKYKVFNKKDIMHCIYWIYSLIHPICIVYNTICNGMLWVLDMACFTMFFWAKLPYVQLIWLIDMKSDYDSESKPSDELTENTDVFFHYDCLNFPTAQAYD